MRCSVEVISCLHSLGRHSRPVRKGVFTSLSPPCHYWSIAFPIVKMKTILCTAQLSHCGVALSRLSDKLWVPTRILSPLSTQLTKGLWPFVPADTTILLTVSGTSLQCPREAVSSSLGEQGSSLVLGEEDPGYDDADLSTV